MFNLKLPLLCFTSRLSLCHLPIFSSYLSQKEKKKLLSLQEKFQEISKFISFFFYVISRYKGVMMFAVGVGKNVHDKELSDISSNPDQDFTFHVDTFQDLGDVAQTLAQKTCLAVNMWNNDKAEKQPG